MQKENINKHNINWPWNPDHWCRPLIITGKTNAVLNLTKQQDDDDCSIIDKIYFCVKDPYEAKYQCLIKNLKKKWS